MTPKDRNKIVQFRLTEDEFQILQEETTKAGFQNVSEYLRHMITGRTISIIDEKLNAILKKLDQEGKIAALVA